MTRFQEVRGLHGKRLQALRRTLLASIASLAILAVGPLGITTAIADGGGGGGTAGGADSSTGPGGDGATGGFLASGGGGGAGQTGGSGGGPSAGAGGLAPGVGTFVGGNGGDGSFAGTGGGGGGGGAHGFVGTTFVTLTGPAVGGDGGNGAGSGGGGAGGYGVVITGTGNLGNSGQTATGGDGGDGASLNFSAGGGGSGGDGMVFTNGTGPTVNINAIVTGGNGGNGGTLPLSGSGSGGAGGDGVVSENGGDITTSAAVSGGDGGANANGGNGIVFGGSGTLTTGATTTGGDGATGGAGIVVTGTANLNAGGTVTGGSGGGAGVSFASTGIFTISGTVTGGSGGVGANVTSSTTTNVNGALTGGDGGAGGTEFGVVGTAGGAGASGLVLTSGGTVNVNDVITGGAGGAGGGGQIGGAGGSGGIAIVLTNGGTVNVNAAITGGQGGAGGSAPFLGGAAGSAAAGISGAGIDVAMTTPGTVSGGGGANAITFTGGTNSITATGGIITGVVRVDTGAALDIDGATLNLTNAISNIQVGGTLNLAGIVTTGDIAQITTTGSEMHFDNGASVATPIVLDSNDTTLDVDTGDSAEQSGNITEIDGVRPIEKTGGGSLVLSGTNTYTGTTTVSGGTLELQNGSAIADTGAVVLDDTAGVNLVVTDSETIGSLSGGGVTGGNVQIGSGQTLSTGGDNTPTTFDGAITGSGGLTKFGTGTFMLSGNSGYGGTTTVKAGVLDVTGSLTGTSQVDITGGTFIAHGTSIADTATVNVSGTGVLDIRSSETIGALANNNVVSLGQNNITGDVLTTGVMSGTGTVNLDINLQTGATDMLHVASVQAGANTTYSFDNLGVAKLIPDVLVVQNDAATYDGTYSSTGLPPVGLVNFSLVDNGGDLYVHAAANLGVLGGITDAVALTQSTIGAMLDHPSGRFGTALTTNVPGSDCGGGTWERGLGGRASASATTATDTGSSAGSSTVDLGFAGAQFGLDLACSNVGSSDIDVTFGLMGGFNTGSSTQEIDGSAPTEASFQQGFGGIYATIAKDRLSAEVQARYDSTDFVFNNTNPSFGLLDAGLHTDRYTVSGSASYALSLGEVDLTPRAGFSVSQTTASVLEFEHGETLAPDASLSLVGFIGGTLSKTFLLGDQSTAFTPFLTGTLYNDFAPGPTSVFTDQVGNKVHLVSQNQGLAGEAGVGAGISRPFGDNGKFDTSFNLDARFSDHLEGYGLTAKARIQF